MTIRVRRLNEDERFEADTPNATITLLRKGEYRLNANPHGATTSVVVRHREVEVTGGGQAFTLRAGNEAQLSGTDQFTYNVQPAPPDPFEACAEDRDAGEGLSMSAWYLPSDGRHIVRALGLDRAMGWTNEAWGFAPCHYGRLGIGRSSVGTDTRTDGRDRWRASRSRGASGVCALVAFIGGGNWESRFIGGAAVDWVPPEPARYTPAYQVSPTYFQAVNVSNTTVINTVNIANAYNNVYVNKISY